MDTNPIFRFVNEIKETSDTQEVARLLSTGEWIAIFATTAQPPLFSLGRIKAIPCIPNPGK